MPLEGDRLPQCAMELKKWIASPKDWEQLQIPKQQELLTFLQGMLCHYLQSLGATDVLFHNSIARLLQLWDMGVHHTPYVYPMFSPPIVVAFYLSSIQTFTEKVATKKQLEANKKEENKEKTKEKTKTDTSGDGGDLENKDDDDDDNNNDVEPV